MIVFHLPNYRMKVAEIKINEHGREVVSPEKHWRYCFADDDKQALALISSRDNFIYIDKASIEQWDFGKAWENEVNNVKNDVLKAISNNKDPNFKDNWKQLKEHLLDLFHGKCGYCEARFTPTSFGDVEHYRPKGKVSEEPTHKGYYWLAYEPTNYLPACQLCNEPAKRDHFPIDGKRAYSENDPLKNEKPLLINPYRDHYEKHLEFLPSTYSFSPKKSQPGARPLLPGDVIGKTRKGNFTISTMEIYRDPIRQDRLSEMAKARLEIKNAYKKLGDTENWDEFAQSLKSYLSEDRPFRTAVYYEFRDYLIRVKYWNEDTVKQAFKALGFNP
jgi:hypothetical protein